jgi:pimeloyl-ACP methyl ester carboxylesterase
MRAKADVLSTGGRPGGAPSAADQDESGRMTRRTMITRAGALTLAGTDPKPWSRSLGRGRPIVFLHGWMMDHRDERRTFEPIFVRRRGWRRVYLDLPGMGRTPADPSIRNLDDMLARVLDAIERLVGDEPFALCGTSAGALLARGVAAKLPEQVDGLLLRAPLIEPEDSRRDVSPVQPLHVDPAAMANLPPALQDQLGSPPIQTPSYLAALIAKHSETVAPAMAAANRAFLDPIRNDPQRYRLSLDLEAQPFTGPALVVAGRLDQSVGFRDAWRVASRMPRATFVVLDRAEHGLPVDQNEIFAALVGDWLDRLEETRRLR